MSRKVTVTVRVSLVFVFLLNGRVVDGKCSSTEYDGCIAGPLQIVEDWNRNRSFTESAIKTLCKANTDMWNCLIKYDCNVTDLQAQQNENSKNCADLEAGKCTPVIYNYCVAGPLQIVQDWNKNRNYTDPALKTLCTANTDMWNCLVKYHCNVTDIQAQYNDNMKNCAKFNSGVSIYRESNFILTSIMLSLVLTLMVSLNLHVDTKSK